MSVLNGVVATDYFKTMGMTLLAGREFTERDNEGAPRTVIINDALARRYWPGQDALGKHIRVAGGRQLEVVGVVKDANAYIFQQDVDAILLSSSPAKPITGNDSSRAKQG